MTVHYPNALQPPTEGKWMFIRKLLKWVADTPFYGRLANSIVTHVHGKEVVTQIHECGHSTPLLLSQGADAIDLLVRVRDGSRRHSFNLVFVEKTHWPIEKKMSLWRIYDGKLVTDPTPAPYPVKLNFRLQQLDSEAGRIVNQTVSERDPAYSVRHDARGEIGRVHQIYAGQLTQGVYRVQISNLVPAAEIDFETLLLFEKDRRRH